MYIYLLENQEGTIYIGLTQDIRERLKNHNNETQKGWTRSRGPWNMIYTEEYSTRGEAMEREKYLKGLKAGRRIKQILHIIE